MKVFFVGPLVTAPEIHGVITGFAGKGQASIHGRVSRRESRNWRRLMVMPLCPADGWSTKVPKNGRLNPKLVLVSIGVAR